MSWTIGKTLSKLGVKGYDGWTPVLALVQTDGVTEGVGNKNVLKIVDHVGGEGTKPTISATVKYLGAGGLTTIDLAIDIAGADGVNGADGNGITSIALINTVDLVKTYRITFDDASTFDFDVTDGDQGIQGIQGVPGVSLLEYSTGSLNDIVSTGVYKVYENPITLDLTEEPTFGGDIADKGILIHDESQIFSSGPGDGGRTQWFLSTSDNKTRGILFVRVYNNIGAAWTAWAPLHVSTIKDVTGNSDVQCSIVDIGDWNMQSSASVNVAHGLTSSKIISVSASIVNDLGTFYSELPKATSSFDPSITWGSTNITLNRAAGSIYADPAYSTTSYNRGKIFINHIL